MKLPQNYQAFIERINLNKKSAKGLKKIQVMVDDLYQCETREYIDDPDFPIKKKISIIEGLNLKNQIFGTYRKIFKTLRPLIEEVNRREKRPFKILEIAGGLGDLSIGIYREFLKNKNNLEVEIIGSDIIPEYIKISKEKAKALNLSLDFKIIDALDLKNTIDEKFDIVISLHSIHHFPPLQLFQLVQKSQTMARYGLLAVDGTRNIWNLSFMFFSSLMPTILFFNFMYLHDAIISGRKMYSRTFLRELAKSACPESKVTCEKLSLGLNYLRVTPKDSK